MIDDLFTQIKSKDSSASIYKAMTFQDGEETIEPDPVKVSAWLEGKGEDAVRERIKAVGKQDYQNLICHFCQGQKMQKVKYLKLSML